MVGFFARCALGLALAVGAAHASEVTDHDLVEVRTLRTAGAVLSWGAPLPVIVTTYASLIAGTDERPAIIGARVSQAMLVLGPPMLFVSALNATRTPGYRGGRANRLLAQISAGTYGGLLFSMVVAEVSFRSFARTQDPNHLALGVLHVSTGILCGAGTVVTGSIASIRSTRNTAFGLPPRAALVPVVGPGHVGVLAAVGF